MEDWEAIALKVTKRKRDDKESVVWIDDEVVSEKKLRKEVSRYSYKASFPQGNHCPPNFSNFRFRILIVSQHQLQRHLKDSTSVPPHLCMPIGVCCIISLGSGS